MLSAGSTHHLPSQELKYGPSCLIPGQPDLCSWVVGIIGWGGCASTHSLAWSYLRSAPRSPPAVPSALPGLGLGLASLPWGLGEAGTGARWPSGIPGLGALLLRGPVLGLGPWWGCSGLLQAKGDGRGRASGRRGGARG